MIKIVEGVLDFIREAIKWSSGDIGLSILRRWLASSNSSQPEDKSVDVFGSGIKRFSCAVFNCLGIPQTERNLAGCSNADPLTCCSFLGLENLQTVPKI